MKRILMMVFRNILLVPYMWCKLCYYASHVEKYTERQRYDMLKFIVKRANRGGNVHIDVHGQDNIPKEDGFMFFPNHQGLYDVLAIVDACPDHPFSVVAKQEVKNIQFLKQVFACMKAFTIDRDDVRQSMKVIMAVSEEVKTDVTISFFRKERDQKMEIKSENLKVEASKQRQKQNVRLCRLH